jgi:hypothetical protein
MGYEVKRLPGENILITTAIDPFDFLTDLPPMFTAIDQARQGIAGKIINIYDLSGLTLTFSDLVVGLAGHMGGAPGSISDPTILSITVGSDELVHMGVEAFKQPQYGALKLELFTSLDEAVERARVLAKGV